MVKDFADKLDLRCSGKLSPDISAVFNEISFGQRSGFNDLVSAMSESHKGNIDWWVQGPASRNTLSSPFFYHYCSLYLVKYLVDNNRFTFKEVVLDSLELKLIVKNILASSGITQCKVCVDRHKLIKFKVKQYLKLPALFLKKVIQQIIVKLTFVNDARITADKPLVLIDTFMIDGYAENDRWYGELWDNLSVERRKEIFFVPTVVNTSIRRMTALYKNLRVSSKNYLIKEDYLNFGDIVFSFRHLFRIMSISIKPVFVLGYDVSPLVKRELLYNEDMLTVIESLLVYRFIKKLSKCDFKIRLAIDWFEGQAIDKAWNMAFNHFYPSVKRVGYRATESFPFYLCSYPIAIERDSNVIPDVIAVQGEGTIPTVTEFLPDLDVMVIPAFRSQYVWKFDKERKVSDGFNILVSLPISVETSMRIILRLVDFYRSNDLGQKKIKFIIKIHPVNSLAQLKKSLAIIDLPEIFLLSEEKSFPLLLKNASLLITEASCTCLEAVACGIPVIIMENEEGLTFDPIPDRISANLYRKTRTQAQLVEAVIYFIDLTKDKLRQQKIDSLKVRDEYFVKITKTGINRFLNIEMLGDDHYA
jgi:hypothetical protein